jgi:hypothetical protein
VSTFHAWPAPGEELDAPALVPAFHEIDWACPTWEQVPWHAITVRRLIEPAQFLRKLPFKARSQGVSIVIFNGFHD